MKKVSSGKNYKIIVVENGSNDKSKKILETKYKNDIDIVISNKNLGFANGNNLGCNKAIKEYKPDYLIVLNNDTYIKQDNFLEKYILKKSLIYWDHIYDKNLKLQNPQLNLLTNILEVEKLLKNYEKNYLNINKLKFTRKIKKF